jgi:hypothetical protein
MPRCWRVTPLFDDMPFHAAMHAYAIIAIVVMPAVAAILPFHIYYFIFITPLRHYY